jgi:hypothetical protein
MANSFSEDILQSGMGVRDALLFGQIAAKDPEYFNQVFEFCIHHNDKRADKAAWIIYKAALECDCPFIEQYQDRLMMTLIHQPHSAAVKRELLKVLLQLKPENHEHFGLLFDRAKEWMFEPNVEAAVRYAALNVIELGGKKYPEMIPECWEIIQEAKELAEGPWQRRCKRVQESLNRLYLKWSNKKG